MSDKLSLGNFKLNKSDLESRILAKLLTKDADASTNVDARNKRGQNQYERDNLTKTEKAARVKALLKVQSMQKDASVNSARPTEQVTTTPAVNARKSVKHSGHNKGVERESNGAEEKQKGNKREFVTKKVGSNSASKKYSKYNQLVAREEANALRTKKRHNQYVKLEKKKVVRKIKIRSAMTVCEISAKVFEPQSKVIGVIRELDNSINVEKAIEPTIVELIVQELGHVAEVNLRYSINRLTMEEGDDPESLQQRPPIVTIMGHVDHGKTTLIDALRNSNVTDTEHGGITQHIGAYQIVSSDNLITIIDTPGHAAFTAMRARGAKVTDIAVLVIAADDSIKEQTVEAINHIQAAKVPIIVAVNKIDKPGANIQRVVNELLQYNIIAEELGGDVLVVPISAKDKLNLDKLEEAILLQAELLEINANPNKKAKGVILEAQLDKRRGVLVTLIVGSGTLKKGDVIVAGTSYCKVRAMVDCYGKHVEKVLPSTPVEVLGFDIVPVSGDPFVTPNNEKDARSIIEVRSRNSQQMEISQDDMHDLFQDDKQQVTFVIKADTQGSIEAIADCINKFKVDEVDVNLLHKAVGAITESDVLLAAASGASIILFCIKEDKKMANLAKRSSVIIRHYSIIYNLISDIKDILSGFLPLLREEKAIGDAVVREIFNVSKVGKIAGCYVQDGFIKRDMHARLLRDSKVVYEGKIKTLRRFKKDEKEVKNGYECGISLENYGDVKVGDVIESFEIIETKQSL